MTKYNPEANPDEQSSVLNTSDDAILNDVSVDQSLYFLLRRLVDEKKEKDDAFEDRYGNINYQQLITNLKYFISDYQSMANDPLAGEAESNFQQVPLTPKFGPFGSASELYVIPGWDDKLIELIQNEFSVYPTTQIDFNKITANMLKILFPTMLEDEIQEFFLWRDDPEQPKTINSKEDFKKYIVDQARLMSDADFDARIALFEKSGISFGSNPNLFKVVSQGSYNRSTYTLVAYVVLPKQEQAPATCPQGQVGTPPNCTLPDGTPVPPTTPPTTPAPPATPAQNTQILEPRIIEIQIN